MVTINNLKNLVGASQPDDCEFKGLSTDEKPTWCAANSLFLELDTGDFYYLKSQGGSSTTRETLIEEQSLECEKSQLYDYYFFNFLNTEISEDVIKVVFDGITYVCEKRDISEPPVLVYEYGAVEDGNEFDFSEYPFCIESNNEGFTGLYVADGNEHTIEVYTESTVTVDPVWEKVGSGGSEPTEEGYEINNHVLTINYDNHFDAEMESTKTFVDDNGYLSFGHISIPVGESTISTVVRGYSDGEGGYDYYYNPGMRTQDIDSTSNLVNCTYSDATVFITDPTQDASIDIVVGRNVE